jgi:CubicO group peptidase (beta-lactamase class C family)
MTFADRIDPLLASAIARGGLAGVVTTVESAEATRYTGAAGHFELEAGGPAYGLDTPLRIASMTKAVTSVATMQLVERGLVDLDAPVARWLPALKSPEVLEHDGILRPARTPITARQLLTHTSGFGYTIWNDRLAAYLRANPPQTDRPGAALLAAPLASEPGTRWEYSISTDWLGELIRTLSGRGLGEYFRESIFEPLGMTATGFQTPANPASLPPTHQRHSDGSLERAPTTSAPASRATYESGGGGLHSTPRDYGRFLRMLLGRGTLEGAQILQPATVEEMAKSHTGDLEGVGVLTTADPATSDSGDMSFGHAAGFGLGFLVTLETSRTGRTAGSLSWGGLFNTYYWLDLERDVAGAIYTQVLPFLDRTTLDLAREFERATYEALDA